MSAPEVTGRNGVTRAIFDESVTFDLAKGFPLLTTKKMFWRGVVEELLFFIRGDTNANHLRDLGIHIWSKNTTRESLDARNLVWAEGDMGPMYGFNWRHYGAEYKGCDESYYGLGHDQLISIIDQLKKGDGSNRRMMMTTYNPATVEQCVLPPCHGIVTQFYGENGVLHCKMYQRSADVFLGLPFNIASYALLTSIIAKLTGFSPGKLTITIGCAHIYKSHYAACEEQLTRKTLPLPQLTVMVNDIDFITPCMLPLRGYEFHPTISAVMVE
jgi:thymidylate synthase